jgi:hypothetical protein
MTCEISELFRTPPIPIQQHTEADAKDVVSLG